MKNFILFKTMAIIVAMVATISLASCGDDEEPVDPAELKGLAINYSLESSDDLRSFFDITVVYGADDNSGTAENITSERWVEAINYGENNTPMPNKVFFKAIAKPKANIPAIDPEKVYKFKATYVISVSGIRNDNQYTILNHDNGSRPSLNIKGEKVQDLLDKGEIVIANYMFNVPVK